jgi:WD40 repeat protein
VKLWDLTQKRCVQTYTHHSDKVQVARWNPSEESVLFSAGFDKTIQLFDARSNAKRNALN